MDNFVITIARQYGSGGRTVGEMLAKKLGIGYYDKDIIRMASEDSGIHETLFGRVDEYSSAKKPLFGKNGIYSGELISPQSKDFTSDENLFNYQAKIIRELAGKESCVIIGRCSNYILKDYPNVLRVFIHADWDFRMEKAAEKLSMSQKEIEKFLQQDSTIARGAGHHSVLHVPNTEDYYIVYHRRPLNDNTRDHRVTCIDRMTFDENGFINPVKMTFEGVPSRTIDK